MRKFNTLTGFLASKATSIAVGDIVEFQGYSAKGDGGYAQWKHNGVTGQTPSQSPAQLGDALLNDGNGNQWALVVKASNTYDQLSSLTAFRVYNAGIELWSDDTNPAQLISSKGRAFFGDAADNSGGFNPSSETPDGRTWLGTQANGYMSYFDSRSLVESINPKGGITYAGGIRSSDNDRPTEKASIVYAAYGKNDDTSVGALKSVWGYYGHVNNSSIESRFTTAMELATANQGTTVECNPYLTGTIGTTANIWLQNGGETAESGIASNPCSVSVAITAGASGQAGARFKRGMVFGAKALVGTDGDGIGEGTAIALARNHKIEWFYAGGENSVGASHTSDVTNAPDSTHIVHKDNGLAIEDSLGNEVVRFNPAFGWLPGQDGVYDIGAGSLRIKTINLVNAPSVTSDATMKTNPLPITDTVLDAWADVDFISYKLLLSIDKKGQAARTHFGVIAQQVESAFKAHNLDAFEYGILCRETWEAETVKHHAKMQNVLDDEGNQIYELLFDGENQPVMVEITAKEGDNYFQQATKYMQVVIEPAYIEEKKAGSLLSVRYEEMLILEAALNRREIARLKALI